MRRDCVGGNLRKANVLTAGFRTGKDRPGRGHQYRNAGSTVTTRGGKRFGGCGGGGGGCCRHGGIRARTKRGTMLAVYGLLKIAVCDIDVYIYIYIYIYVCQLPTGLVGPVSSSTWPQAPLHPLAPSGPPFSDISEVARAATKALPPLPAGVLETLPAWVLERTPAGVLERTPAPSSKVLEGTPFIESGLGLI